MVRSWWDAVMDCHDYYVAFFSQFKAEKPYVLRYLETTLKQGWGNDC